MKTPSYDLLVTSLTVFPSKCVYAMREKRQPSTLVYLKTLQLPMFYTLLDGGLRFHVNISYWESVSLCL